MSFDTFTSDNIKQLQERQRSVEQLQKLGNVWVSPDLKIEKPVLVNPGEFLLQGANLVLNKKKLPDMDLTRGAFGSLNWSVRSFLAQSGVEIMFHNSSLTDKMLQDINNGEDLLVPIDIRNYGQRAFELDGNVMRFFWVNDRNRLRGEDLVNVIKSGEFFVEGVEGEDWYLGGYDQNRKIGINEEGSDKSLCVVIKLKPEKFYIPYNSEPIRRDESIKIREQLSNLLVEVPKGEKLELEIGETPRMKLSANVVGVINTGAEAGQRHINSPFIDAGSDWPIRTETNGLQYIEVFLYKK